MNLNKQNKISVLLKLISLTIIMLISFMFILPNKNTSAEKNNAFYKSVMNLNNENDDIKFKSKMVDVVKNLFK